MQKRAKIGLAVAVGVCATIALIVIVVVSTGKKGDDQIDPGPLDGPWDNVSWNEKLRWAKFQL